MEKRLASIFEIIVTLFSSHEHEKTNVIQIGISLDTF
jgi:hypothetical protein